MIEIRKEEKKVLGCLVHPEKIAVVTEETGLPPKVVKDIVRTLWHYRFIKAVDIAGNELLMVDADMLHKARFCMTAKGIKAYESAE